MSEAVRGLVTTPGSVRARLIARGPENALYTGYDSWTAVDMYCSEFRDAYLAGSVKIVRNVVRTKLATSAHESYSIIPTWDSEKTECAKRHKDRLLSEIQAQYKNAIVRRIGILYNKHSKQLARIRNRCNNSFAELTPTISDIAGYFRKYPDAIEYAEEIKAVWNEVASR